MTWRSRPCLGTLGAILALASAVAGCGDARSNLKPGSTTSPTTSIGDGSSSSMEGDEKKAILDNVVQLIKTAPQNPGGTNFSTAAANLNQYFEHTPAAEFAMSEATRAYLSEKSRSRLTDVFRQVLEAPEFTDRDARHIEDCLLYQSIAARMAGDGEDLERVTRVFDWVVGQIGLVPAGALVPVGEQAKARPYDVLLRGLAVEERGGWAERTWVFMALCRQLSIDAGLIVYAEPGKNEGVPWICAVLIDKKLYLFDARLGMPIPGPDGTGVATLDQAAADPRILERMDLPGQSPYGTTAADLARSKIVILTDSSKGYLTTRMRLLQRDLSGKQRMVLFRDSAEQRDAFLQALGSRSGAVEPWPLPIEIETRLFTDSNFVKASQYPLVLFDARLGLPLLQARMSQLRGDLAAAVPSFVGLLNNDNLTMNDPGDPNHQKIIPVPREIQQGLNLYATYFLALYHLEQNHHDQAQFLFENTLKLLAKPHQGGPFHPPFQWGAQANLGRLHERKGNLARAIAYDCMPDRTWQGHGNLLRARSLVWRDPTAPAPEPVPRNQHAVSATMPESEAATP